MKGKSMGIKFVVLLLASLSVTVHSETWTLRAAQERLLQGNPDLRIQKNEQGKAEAQLSESKSTFWPSLDVSGSYQAFSELNQINLTLPVPPPTGTNISKTLGDHDREEYGIDLSYPLFMGGGQRQQVLARRSSVEAQKERAHALENQQSLRLAGLFYAWNLAESARHTQETIIGYHQQYLTRVTSLVKGGAALPSKESSAKAKLLVAQAELQTSIDLRDSIGRAGALLLGLSANQSFAFDSSDGEKIDSGKVSSEMRPELAFLVKTSVSLEHQENAILSQKFPTLVALAGYRVANPGLNLGSNAYMNYGLVGLQLRWNLFDGFRNQSQRSQIRAQHEELQIEQERQAAFFSEAQISVEKWMARLKQSQEAAQAAWDAAHLSLAEIQSQHDHGTASELELLDARVQETKAGLQVHQLILQQRLAVWNWRYARGENLKFQGD